MKCGKKTQSGRKCQNGLNCRFHNKKGGSPKHFDDLPRELVAKVATYLDPEDFARFSQVNRTTRYVSNDRYTNRERIRLMELTRAEKNELLFESAKRGDLKTIRALFENENPPDIHRFNKALRIAADYGRLAVVRYLVEEHNANVNAKSIALNRAAYHGHFAVVRYLVENGANVNYLPDDWTY